MDRSKAFLLASLFCSILTLCHISCVISKPNGFSLKLIHGYSTLSYSHHERLINFETLRRLVEISKSRASYLQLISEIGMRNSTFVPNTIRPRIALNDLLFVVDATLGTPRKKISLIFDTASDLTWTQCKPCRSCFKQKYPIFNPKNSSSYEKLFPNHRLSRLFNCTKKEWKYSRSYADGDWTKGVASIETFTFQSTTGDLEPVRDVVFGCGNDNRGFGKGKSLMTGILGMDKSPLSFVGQLGNRVTQRFSYCFPTFSSPSKASFLRFGNDIARRGRNLQQITFVRRSTDNMYATELIDISVGGRRLGFRRGSFPGGCVIDSGSAVSSIQKEAYNLVLNAFIRHFGQFNLTRVYSKILCYELPRGFDNCPNMTFHFQGANLEVAKTNLFLIENGTFCLAMLGLPGETVLGAYQQQNFRFIFDIANNKLSFSEEDCSKDGT